MRLESAGAEKDAHAFAAERFDPWRDRAADRDPAIDASQVKFTGDEASGL
jgi:hypothetical protein